MIMYTISAGVNLIISFGVKLLTLFLRLDIFNSMLQILFTYTKWSSLHKIISKFIPKEFYKIDPRCRNCVIMANVVTLNVIMLNFVAPNLAHPELFELHQISCFSYSNYIILSLQNNLS